MQMSTEFDLGPQPLEDILNGWGLSHHNLVEVSPEQLTHKQVQRASSGRKLTLKMKQKVSNTMENNMVHGYLTMTTQQILSEVGSVKNVIEL